MKAHSVEVSALWSPVLLWQQISCSIWKRFGCGLMKDGFCLVCQRRMICADPQGGVVLPSGQTQEELAEEKDRSPSICPSSSICVEEATGPGGEPKHHVHSDTLLLLLLLGNPKALPDKRGYIGPKGGSGFSPGPSNSGKSYTKTSKAGHPGVQTTSADLDSYRSNRFSQTST